MAYKLGRENDARISGLHRPEIVHRYREPLREHGWVLLKNVFSPEEVEQLRSGAYQSVKEGHYAGDILSNPLLEHVIYHPKIVEVLWDVMGEEPVYFGDSVISIASVEGRIQHGLHKDNVDRLNADGRDWNSEYSIVRMGIYLEDHKNHSEGLIVREASHKFVDTSSGKLITVPSEPGDVVMWYLTTTHCGGAKRPRFPKNYTLLLDRNHRFRSSLYYRLPSWLTRPGQKDRVAFFLAYGRNDEHLPHYLEYLKNRKYAVRRWQKSAYSPELMGRIAQRPIKVLNMEPEVRGLPFEHLP